jgi:hypothetical protein
MKSLNYYIVFTFNVFKAQPPLGISRQVLEQSLGGPLEDSVSLRVVINLPDESDETRG